MINTMGIKTAHASHGMGMKQHRSPHTMGIKTHMVLSNLTGKGGVKSNEQVIQKNDNMDEYEPVGLSGQPSKNKHSSLERKRK